VNFEKYVMMSTDKSFIITILQYSIIKNKNCPFLFNVEFKHVSLFFTENNSCRVHRDPE